MKNIILPLLAVFFMSSGCEKEDILNLKDQAGSADLFPETFFDVDEDGYIDLLTSNHNKLDYDCEDEEEIDYTRIAVINSFDENTLLLLNRVSQCIFIAKPGDKIEQSPSSSDSEWTSGIEGFCFAYKHHYKDEFADKNPSQTWQLSEGIDVNALYVPVKILEGESNNKIGWVKFKINFETGVAEIAERQFTTGSEIAIP